MATLTAADFGLPRTVQATERGSLDLDAPAQDGDTGFALRQPKLPDHLNPRAPGEFSSAQKWGIFS